MMKYLFCITVATILLILGVAIAAGMGRDKLRKGRGEFRVAVEQIKDGRRFKASPGDYGRELRVDRRKRFYEIHVPPSYNNSKPMPVVLVFHGGGGDPGTIRFESGMDNVADREGFIVVYPGGTNKRLVLRNRLLLWNDGRPFKDGSYSKVDDVGFVSVLLDDLEGLFNIDKKRIYACGYSNGAQLSYRLAKRLSNRIAAVAAVAGQRPVRDDFDPPPPRPISVMQFSGLKDKIGPYHGGQPSIDAELQTELKPVKETIGTWVEFNGCSNKPEVTEVGAAVMERYAPCKNETEVVLWTLKDGGHTWPGGSVIPGLEKMLGPVNKDINASKLMWEFFERNPLKK